VPGIVTGNLAGRPATQRASCSSLPGGRQEIFQVTPATSGTMALDLSAGAGNLSLSVRKACADDASEIACGHKQSAMMSGDVTLAVPVTMGQTYFVMVQGMMPADTGTFSLDFDLPLPETVCDDLVDDDGNGYTDCDDPNCQMVSSDCVPGGGATGQACTANTECTANHHDPLCLDVVNFPQFPGGYCSAFCSDSAQDCSAGDVCYAGLGVSKHGVCLHACTTDSDCRTAEGYACVDKGLSSKVCWLGPEAICDDYVDNDLDGLTDCADPHCQPLPACVPGTRAIGQPCTQHSQCAAPAGKNDPICLDEAHLSFTKGYCSHFCDPAAPNGCGPTGICSPSGPGNAYVCLQTCTTSAQCRTADGYSCQSTGLAKMVCQ
jgi:hypothetical protein